MSNPIHSDDIRQERQAVAPYNFVPLPESIHLVEKPPSQGIYDEKLLTGKISCKLTNSTPIYVRAAQTLGEYGKGDVSSEHFYHGESGDQKYKLLIPGSSIRGMLRTLVEVVSHSRVSPITNKQLFYRSVENTSMGEAYRERMKDKVRAGFFHRDKTGAWIIPTTAARVERSAIRSEFHVDNIYEEFDEKNKPIKASSPKRVPNKKLQHQTVFVKLNEKSLEDPSRFFPVTTFSNKNNVDLEEATLVITGDMKVKPAKDGTKKEKKEFVFLKPVSNTKIDVLDQQVDLFEDKDQLSQYQGFAFPKTKGRKMDGGVKDGDPVFYLIGNQEDQIIGFGRAYMFRLPYRLSPLQMLPNSLTDDLDRYDMTEALFGYVPQSNEGRKQTAGRVSFSDAIMQGKIEDALLNETQLKILASPKATAFQHYLTQSKPNEPDLLSHYDTPKDKATLRGHKFYWHKGAVQSSDFATSRQNMHGHDSQYSPPVKPVRENQVFTFDLSFENLRLEELGALLWVLDKAKDEQYRLKLGMGKPYGLGSISIGFSLKIENRVQRYKIISFGEKSWNIDLDPETDHKAALARSAFANWLLNDQNATTSQVDALPRIQELLIMLSWNEHPSTNKTRYMDLEEFAGRKSIVTGQSGYHPKRPVLPNPHLVFGKWLKQPSLTDNINSIPVGYERGVVKEFGLGERQSYGSILRSNGAELFVHLSGLSKGLATLSAGQKVIFKVAKTPKGPQAQDVQLEK